ncbi:hypothetical protein D3C76_852720 [compost metagenome]
MCALARTSASSRYRSPIRISDKVNSPPALAPNSTHSGQISKVSISNGIARLETSSTTAQPINNVRRDTRSASAPMGSCSKASPTTTVLTIAKAISVVKPWRRQ